MYSLFAVVVTYNGLTCITTCLDSLRNSDLPVRVIVVDNASTDGTPDLVAESFHDIDLLRLTQNLGFGRGNNIGIRKAYAMGAEHAVLLNQDAHVDAAAIRLLAQAQRREPRFGVLTPVHLDGDGTRPDALFASHLCSSRFVSDLLSDFVLDEGSRDVYTVPFANAAAWMLSRRCIEDVGLFNPVFKHYGEDLEYVHRAKNKGYLVGFVPHARAYHHRPQSQDMAATTLPRFRLQERALIRYRLCRRQPAAHLNVLSALSRVFFSSLPPKTRLLTGLSVRMGLLFFLIENAGRILTWRNQGYAPLYAFFRNAEADAARYLLP
jgi:GT2 family glycosyltransferase